MSKGSSRRPGEGYGDGWSRIFEKNAVFSSFMNCENPRNLLDVSKPVQVYEDSSLYRREDEKEDEE